MSKRRKDYPMDKLRTIIRTFSSDAQKDLVIFIQRQKKKRSRKDLDLLNILSQDTDFSPKEIVKKLYPKTTNKVAYHALRKRLMQHLQEFIMLRQLDDDPSTASSIMGMISMARYLFKKRAVQLGWEMIRKAEKLATEYEHYDLLNTIYNLQIQNADHEFADPLEEIIVRYEANKILAAEDERAVIANSLIRQQLKAVRLRGLSPEFDFTIREVLDKYQLSEAVSTRPRLFYNLMSITRSSVLARKDYYNFEPLIIRWFEEMEEKGAFSRQHHSYKLELLYMISHVLYRNKKFERSLSYLKNLEDGLLSYRKSHYDLFYPRVALLKAANHVFTGRVHLAIRELEDFLNERSDRLSVFDILNARLNLGYYYILTGDKSATVRCSLEINHSDQWLSRKMGREWVLKKNLSELLLQYELGNYDLAANRIRSLERNFGDLLNLSVYQKVPVYLSFIKKMINDPEVVFTAKFHKEVDNSFEFLPIEKENIQEMGFYAWLKSKMTRRDFYEVLLDLSNQVEKV